MGRMLSDKQRRAPPLAARPIASVVTPVAPPLMNRQLQMPGVMAPDPDESGTFRKLGFYFGVAFIFTRVSVLPEFLNQLIGTNLYILYLIAPPAVAGVLLTGAVRRALRGSPARHWMAFYVWMVLATGFSSWIGGSTMRVRD